MWELHKAVALALVEVGLEAFAFRRRGNVRENIVIRATDARGLVEVWTAFVDGSTLALGKSNLYMYRTYDLNDPGCFGEVGAFLRGNRVDRREEQRYDFRDERFGLGDVLEGWIKATPGFHLNTGDRDWL